MEKEFVPYEQALELKELGFDEPCFYQYVRDFDNDEELIPITSETNHPILRDNNQVSLCSGGDCFAAPLYQQAFRWFREKYGISVSISINWEEGIGKDSSYGKYACSLQHKSYDESIGEFIGVFEKYEKAELKCLKELIEMVKENEL